MFVRFATFYEEMIADLDLSDPISSCSIVSGSDFAPLPNEPAILLTFILRSVNTYHAELRHLVGAVRRLF